jgi:hypothetical protein
VLEELCTLVVVLMGMGELGMDAWWLMDDRQLYGME